MVLNMITYKQILKLKIHMEILQVTSLIYQQLQQQPHLVVAGITRVLDSFLQLRQIILSARSLVLKVDSFISVHFATWQRRTAIVWNDTWLSSIPNLHPILVNIAIKSSPTNSIWIITWRARLVCAVSCLILDFLGNPVWIDINYPTF